MIRHFLFLGMASLFAIQGLRAEPVVSVFSPPIVIQGAETQVIVKGDRLDQTEDVLFYSPGFSLAGIEKKDAKEITLKIKVEDHVPYGRHYFRLRDSNGLSMTKSIVVGKFPQVEEIEPNNLPPEAQPIQLNHTHLGTFENEGVDLYKLKLAAGEIISFELECFRLGQGFNNQIIPDPVLVITDSSGKDVAFCDDHPLTKQDPLVVFKAPKEDEYLIKVHDASFMGEGRYQYAMHVGTFPRPIGFYPAGGRAGQEVELSALYLDGDNLVKEPVKIKLLEEAGEEQQYHVEKNGLKAPTPNFLITANCDNTLELEPNNAPDVATPAVPHEGQEYALNGIIEAPGDEDFFKVTLKKDVDYEIRTFARRIGSPLDSVVSIHNAQGGQLAANDDAQAGALDSTFRFKAPADGDFLIKVRDHLGNGGADYVYRIQISSPRPVFAFSSPIFEINNTHARQQVLVPKGGRYVALVNLRREGVGGDAEFDFANLPEGVNLVEKAVPGSLGRTTMLFEASPEAPLAARAVDARIKIKESGFVGKLSQRLDMVTGPQNNQGYLSKDFDQLPVAVVEAAPFDIELIKPIVPLIQDGDLPLTVKVQRKGEYKGAIRVFSITMPDGITTQSEINIPEGQEEGVFNLSANAQAATGTWPLVVMGTVNQGRGPIYNATQYVPLEVMPQPVVAKIDVTKVEQGQSVEVPVKLEINAPFEGKATIKLVGLPHDAECPPVEFTKDDKEIVLKVSTKPTTPVGKNGNLFCEIVYPMNGSQTIQRSARGTTFRVDAPPKALTNNP